MNEQSFKQRLLHIVFHAGVLILTIPECAVGADLTVFQLKPLKETVILTTGLSLQWAGNNFISKMTGPDLNTLDKNNIPSIDRFASRYYSKKASHISDSTKDAVFGLMFLTTFSLLTENHKEKIQAIITDLVMYAESETIIIGLTNCAKGLSQRSRPYAYNTNLPLGKRRARNASLSFWSGHASLAFTTAVLTGYVYQNRQPGSRFIMPVWMCGLSCATATSILRVRSGNHFPTDVIAGMAAGSCVGWIIPWMHQEKNKSLSICTDINGTSGLGITYSF